MKVTIPEVTFEKLLNATKKSVGTGDRREALNYIKLNVEKDRITAFACDGYRASKITFDAKADEEFVVWFKPFPFKASKSGSRTVKIEALDKYVSFHVQNEIYDEVVYQIERNEFYGTTFATAENLFNENRGQWFAISANFLKDALRAVASVTASTMRTAIIRSFTDDPKRPILVQATDENFDFQQIVLPIRCDL